MRGRQISLACVKNVERRLFRPKICPNIRDEGTQTILAPRPRVTGVKSVIKYSSPAISSWYILGKSFHTMVDFWGCYWRQCSDFVTNSCGESLDSDCEKLLVQVQNHQVPIQKTTNPNLKMLGPLCNQTVNLKTVPKTLYYIGLEIANDTVASVTNIFSLATKNSGLVAKVANISSYLALRSS